VRVTLHKDLLPVSSLPVWCYGSQIDFRFACSLLLNSVLDPPDLTIEIDILNAESKPVASAVLPSFSLDSPPPNVTYFVNHKDLKLLNPRKRACGVITFTAAIATSDAGDPKQQIEPTIRFLDTSLSALEKEPRPVTIEPEPWELEASKNGWMSEQAARAVWEKIAFGKGWKPPQRPRMEIQTTCVDEYTPGDGVLMSFGSDPSPVGSAQRDKLGKEGGKDREVDFVMRFPIRSEPVFDLDPGLSRSERFVVANVEAES
jgi:hypothetical protein